MFCANFNFQTRPRACLEIAFRQVCVPLCGRFGPDEEGVAGYVDRIGTKYTAKWGVQMAGMNFQTRSSFFMAYTSFDPALQTLPCRPCMQLKAIVRHAPIRTDGHDWLAMPEIRLFMLIYKRILLAGVVFKLKCD